MSVPKQTFQSCVVALDQIVVPLSVDMPDAVEMWVVAVINLTNDAPIGLGFIGHNYDRAMRPHTLNSFVQKSFGSLCVPSYR